jgi:cytochrome c biogenesis protein CcdA
MSTSLLGGILGLALLDALNPATLACVALLLVSPSRRPLRLAAAFVAGAYLTVLVLGAAVLGGASVLDDTTVVRRAALTVAAALVLLAAAGRLRTRHRAAVSLPGWVRPWTAVPLGVLVTGADLPNAFPYLVAIERLVSAQVPHGQALLVLAGYAAVYVLPCALLVLAATLSWSRVQPRLQVLFARFGSARSVPASRRAAAGLAAVGVGLLAFAWS